MKKNIYAKMIGDNLREAFKNFKEARTEKCKCCGQPLKNIYTQEWLAKKIGITKATIVHHFQGNREPSASRLIEIADVLGIEVSELLKKKQKKNVD